MSSPIISDEEIRKVRFQAYCSQDEGKDNLGQYHITDFTIQDLISKLLQAQRDASDAYCKEKYFLDENGNDMRDLCEKCKSTLIAERDAYWKDRIDEAIKSERERVLKVVERKLAPHYIHETGTDTITMTGNYFLSKESWENLTKEEG